MKEYPHYWYKFTRDGKVVRRNTKQSNRRTAEELESTHRTRLARGEADLPMGKAPTLAAFNPVLTSRTGKARSTEFYASRMKALLAFPPLANARLSDIDEPLIEKYLASRREEVSPATLNRELATLSKACGSPVIKSSSTGYPRSDASPVSTTVNSCSSATTRALTSGRALIPSGMLRRWSWRRRSARGGTGTDVADVVLEASDGKKFGWLHVRVGKTKAAERVVSLTAKAAKCSRPARSHQQCSGFFRTKSRQAPR